ncbi:MAG: ROK family transcriptional regulator [Anaerolineae bacterium]
MVPHARRHGQSDSGTPSGRAEFIREYNRWLVANLLRREGPLSRVDIAQRLGLSAPAVSRIVETLIGEGYVQEIGLGPASVGRRPRLLQVRADAGTALAIDLRRVTQVEVGIVDIMGNLHASRRRDLPSLDPEAVVATIGDLADEVRAEVAAFLPPPMGAGLGCPGVIDYDKGHVEYSAHLGWRSVPIRDMLARRLGLPVFVDTDCNAPALAESWLGAGARVEHMVYLGLGPGLGIGMVIAGVLYRGVAGVAGELGHTIIQAEGGRPCRCGSSGCIETLLSDEAIIDLARERAAGTASSLSSEQALTVDAVFEAAAAGDAVAGEVVRTVASYAEAVVVSVLNLLNPELVIIDGATAMVEALLPLVRRAANERALPLVGRNVRIEAPSLGEKTVLVGSAMLVLERFWQAPVFDILTTYRELAGTRSIGQLVVIVPGR